MNDFEQKQFGKYFLLKKIAVGGMAEIYKAKTYGVDGFEKQLVIKRILPHCSADKDFITMLIDEAKLSVLLSHANIVQVYDLGKVGEDYYISMEYIHGVNLRDMMYKCREEQMLLPHDISVYIASEICKGLDYAHRKTNQNNKPLGIVHRDISPQNVLISYEGEVKIGDFGIAKAAMNISHTMAGILKGKIAYMSPEQAMGKKIDYRSDIFSTGILLYEMLTGTKLYTGESQFEVLKKIRSLEMTEENLPDSIPKKLRPVVAKALSHDIDSRFQHAGDMQIELTKYLYSTYIDFSPRKLAKSIGKLFEKEIEDEQTQLAGSIEDMTGSVNAIEGAKQMDIVRREPSVPPQTDAKNVTLSKEEKVSEKDYDTIVGTSKRIKKTKAKSPAPPPKPGKSGSLLKTLIALAVTAGLAWGAIKILPHIDFPDDESKIVKEVDQKPEKFGSTEVTSEPSSANIFLDGKDTGRRTPATLEGLSIGKRYIVRIEKEGYGPEDREVRIVSPETVSVNFTLSEPKGVINIITDPPGAAIMLDNKLTGETTPHMLENLPVGIDIRITLSKPGYEDFEQILTLTSTKPQKLSTKLAVLEEKFGSITVDSEPEVASISVDGISTGRTTPATIANLEPGSRKIELNLEGYETWQTSVVIRANTTENVSATLSKKELTRAEIEPSEESKPEEPTADIKAEKSDEDKEDKKEAPAKASLRINSTPSGARIFIDKESTGKTTPTVLDKLKVGATYNIRLELKGYKPAFSKKMINKESESLSLRMVPEDAKPAPTPTTEPVAQPTPQPAPTFQAPSSEPGKIKISTTPSDADVFINSEYKGKSPITVSVPPGQVNVLVNKDGYARHSQSITVQPGKTASLTSIRLGDLYGEVSLITNPPRAQVIFDGQAIPAKTPVTVRKVRTDRNHTVSIQMPGYQTWSTTFSMEGQTTKVFNVALIPK
jgi:serine/threonine protein kinase